MKEALEEFGKALGKLKRAYAEHDGCSINSVRVFIDNDDYVTLLDGNYTGSYYECYREWLDTD